MPRPGCRIRRFVDARAEGEHHRRAGLRLGGELTSMQVDTVTTNAALVGV
jgi:hypothetical protein